MVNQLLLVCINGENSLIVVLLNYVTSNHKCDIFSWTVWLMTLIFIAKPLVILYISRMCHAVTILIMFVSAEWCVLYYAIVASS